MAFRSTPPCKLQPCCRINLPAQQPLDCFAPCDPSPQRGTHRGFCTHNFLSPATMNMIDGMRGQLLSGVCEAVHMAGGAAHWQGLWWNRVQPVLVRVCCASATYPGRFLLPMRSPPTPALNALPTAELTSRGFVQSLEGSSANAQRSDLVRAVLVSQHGLGPSIALCGQAVGGSWKVASA